MMWFFRHFWIFISYHIFLLNQVEGAIAIPPSNSAPMPLFCPSVCLSVCPSIGLLTTFSDFCTFADKSLGRNGIELEMQMFPDDLPLANIDADQIKSNQIKSSLLPYFTADCFPYIIQHSQCSTPMFNSSTRRHVFTQSHICMHMCMCTYAYIYIHVYINIHTDRCSSMNTKVR